MNNPDGAGKTSGGAPMPAAVPPGGAQPGGARPSDKALPSDKESRPGKAADGGRGQAGDPAVRGRGQGERQGFDRQRLEPQDTPPADVRDDQNVAGDKDFELGPPGSS
jgi:hypothetical protein